MNKFEARNTKSETNSKIKIVGFKIQNKSIKVSCFGDLDFSHSYLFRISIFMFHSFGFIFTFSTYSINGGPFLQICFKSMYKQPSFEMKPLKYGIWLTVNRVWQPATH